MQQWAGRAQERPALTAGADTRTWRQLADRTASCARALADSGVRAGDRMAFLDKSSAQFFELLFGSAALGAVTVAVNWRLSPPEIAFVINDAEAQVLVLSSDFLPTYKEFAT